MRPIMCCQEAKIGKRRVTVDRPVSLQLVIEKKPAEDDDELNKAAGGPSLTASGAKYGSLLSLLVVFCRKWWKLVKILNWCPQSSFYSDNLTAPTPHFHLMSNAANHQILIRKWSICFVLMLFKYRLQLPVLFII